MRINLSLLQVVAYLSVIALAVAVIGRIGGAW